jgi:ribonuclease HI
MPFRAAPRRFSPKSKQSELFSAAAPSGCIVAHIDGGARGNPGAAGYGVVVRNSSGTVLAEISEPIKHATNNFAEYSALVAAIDYARREGHLALRVLSDSELVVKQMLGQYKVNHAELRVLHEKAKALARQLGFFEIRHVRREQNRDADRLANLAMDRAERL